METALALAAHNRAEAHHRALERYRRAVERDAPDHEIEALADAYLASRPPAPAWGRP